MNRATLIQNIQELKSCLCIGLDPDLEKIPPHLLAFEDPIFEFNKAIIDATKDHCIAYKPNTAFYEVYGSKGWLSLEKTIAYIPKNKFIIADAKRGDIGNTSSQYAKAFFTNMHCDAITIAPYMGEDSVRPFVGEKEKWAIVLGLTSNMGSNDFQKLKIEEEYLFETVIRSCKKWGTPENMMFVIGATQSEYIKKVRAIIPEHFLLIPGVGAQGGSLDEVMKFGMNQDIGLLINSSRDIIYASMDVNFAEKAREKAATLSKLMAAYF